MENQRPVPPKRLEYKWVVIAVCFLMVFTCLGFCSSNKGLYLSAITEAQGIKRSLFSFNDSFRYVTTALVNLFFGSMVARLGARKMIAAGFLSLMLSMFFYSIAESIWVFYLGGIFLGLGLAWTTTTMAGYVVNLWCKEHKGAIMGFVMAANGLGGALATQIVTPIIYQDGNLFGYQDAYRLVIVILAVTGFISVLLFRNAPRSEDAPKKAKAASDISLRDAMRKPYFYCMAICVFLAGASLQGVHGIAAAHLTDVGLDAAFVGLVVSVHSVALAGSKFLTGLAHDKIGLKKTILICDICACLAFLFLGLATAGTLGKVMGLSYSVFSALGLPLETVIISLITAKLYGQKGFNKMLGIFSAINTAGFAIGSPLANGLYDILGSYRPFLFALVATMILVAFLSQYSLHLADKEKRQALEA